MPSTRSRPKPLDRDGLWEYALRLLAAKSYSVSEMRTRLRRRAAEPADAAETLERLIETRLLDDERLAEGFARARLDNQGFGRRRVIEDLRRRQVPSKIAEQAAGKVFQEADEAELAARFLERKFRGKDLPSFLAEPKNLAAAYRRLRYAGFGASESIRVLKRYSQRADELETMEQSGL